MSRYSDLMTLQSATHYWKLDEASGTVVATTGGLNLSPIGTPIYGADAVVGTGMKFTNASSYLTVGSAPSLNFNASAQLSYSFMLYVHNLALPQGIISRRTDANNNKHFGAFIYTGNALVFDMGANQARWTTSYIVTTGTWMHVAFTFDPTGTRARLYVNGIQVDTTNALAPTSNSVDTTFTIGILGGSVTSIANATIDEVAIFMGKVLSPAEVTAQFATAFPITRVFDGTSWRDADRRVL